MMMIMKGSIKSFQEWTAALVSSKFLCVCVCVVGKKSHVA